MDTALDLGYEPSHAYTTFEPVLSGWTSEELDHASEQIGDLVTHPGWKVLHRLLQEQKARALNGLVRGNPKADGVHYVASLKWLHGLEQTLLAPDAIQLAHEKRIEKDDAEARKAEAQERAA